MGHNEGTMFIDKIPKQEIRNPKQYRMFKIQILKTGAASQEQSVFGILVI